MDFGTNLEAAPPGEILTILKRRVSNRAAEWYELLVGWNGEASASVVTAAAIPRTHRAAPVSME